MLQAVSTKRKFRSDRLRRCEPLWPVNGFFQHSPCPHGWFIREGDYCPVCQKLHPSDQFAVDRSNPPLPVDPVDRLQGQIRHLQAILEAGDLPPRDVIQIRSRITNLKGQVMEWTGNPTSFAPDLPGGTGNVKAKSVWMLAGQKARVQAHTKGEARAIFKRMLNIPAKGRLPVGASLSKVMA